MRPAKQSDSGEAQRLGPRLDQIVDLNHPLVKLAQHIDWAFIEQHLDAVYTDGPGQPPLPTRLMAALAILKHMRTLSDETLCGSWLENPYYQLFCGEAFFRYSLPLERSSMTRWRQRMGEADQSPTLTPKFTYTFLFNHLVVGLHSLALLF